MLIEDYWNVIWGENFQKTTTCVVTLTLKKVDTMTKDAYTAPEMTSLGSFEAITQGGSSSGVLDSQFPIGTPNTPPVFS